MSRYIHPGLWIVAFWGLGNVMAAVEAPPPFAWVKQAGGIGNDLGYSVAVDATNNLYVTGNFFGEANFGGTNYSGGGLDQYFLTKYDPTGKLLWLRLIMSPGNSSGRAVAVDTNHHVIYTTGNFSQTARFGNIALTADPSAAAMFVAKYDAAGNVLWVRVARTNQDTMQAVGTGLAIDPAGNVWVKGGFQGTTTFGAIALTASTDSSYPDGFLSQYDANGNLRWVTRCGQLVSNVSGGLKVDNTGNSYVVGDFVNQTSFGTLSVTNFDSFTLPTMFLAKFNPTGQILWARTAGGGFGFSSGRDVGLDAQGNAYAVGAFNTTITFGNTTLTSNNQFSDGYLAKFDALGRSLWAVGVSNQTKGSISLALAVDRAGNPFTTGVYFGDRALLRGVNPQNSTNLLSSGVGGMYIARHDTNGALHWATQVEFGDFGFADAFSLVLDQTANLLMTGWFQGAKTFNSTNFMFTPYGGNDIFVAKMGTNSLVTTPPTLQFFRSGTQLTLSWPLSPTVFVPAATENLTQPFLTNNLPTPVTAGQSNRITLPLTGRQRFFLLRSRQ